MSESPVTCYDVSEFRQQFQESLGKSLQDTEDDQYLGMNPQKQMYIPPLIHAGISLRELIHQYKHQTLVLFKCCLLQPKVWQQSQGSKYLSDTSLDALLWLTLRAPLHGTVCLDIIDTWLTAKA